MQPPRLHNLDTDEKNKFAFALDIFQRKTKAEVVIGRVIGTRQVMQPCSQAVDIK